MPTTYAKFIIVYASTYLYAAYNVVAIILMHTDHSVDAVQQPRTPATVQPKTYHKQTSATDQQTQHGKLFVLFL